MDNLAYYLFLVSLVVLLVNLVVLLLLCWSVRNARDRNAVKIQLLSGGPPQRLTIITKSDDAQRLLDHLMDRVFVQVKATPKSEEGGSEQLRPDLEEKDGSHASHAPPISQDQTDTFAPRESDASQRASTPCKAAASGE